MLEALPEGEAWITEPLEKTSVCGCCWEKLNISSHTTKCTKCGAEYPEHST